MIKQLGKTSPEEKEILNITLEESAEVIQSISKILRFGWDSCHPTNPNYTNREHMTEEVGDLICMITILFLKGIIDESKALEYAYAKVAKLKKYSDINFKDINMDDKL